MKLEFVENGDIIFEYSPEQKQWWITGFNPNYKSYSYFDVDVLKATCTVWFNSREWYEAFKIENSNRKTIIFNDDCLEVTIVW